MSRRIDKSDILFFDKLLDKVSEETGLEKRAIRFAYDNYVSYLQYVANYTDYLSIQIPYLGTLYIRQRYLDEELLLMSKGKKKDYRRYKAFRSKRKILRENLANYENRLVMKYRVLHIKRGDLSKKRLTKGMNLTEIEDFQNELAETR